MLISPLPGRPLYTEDNEAQTGFKDTKDYITLHPSASQYKQICRLATAVWKYGQQINSKDPNSKDVGITYGMGEVMLIHAVSFSNGKEFHTLYPNYLGKSDYEKSIK